MRFSEFLNESAQSPGYFSTHVLTGTEESFAESIMHDFEGVTLNSGLSSSKQKVLVSQDYDALLNFCHELRRHTSFADTPFYVGLVETPNFVGYPTQIKTDMFLRNHTSLKGINKHFTKIAGKIYTDGTKLKSHVLGVLLIPGVTDISFGRDYEDEHGPELSRIMFKYLPNIMGKDAVFECQEELIDAGLEEYAQL